MNIVKELKFAVRERLTQCLSSFQLDAWRSRLSCLVVLMDDVYPLHTYHPKQTLSQPGLFAAAVTVTGTYNVSSRAGSLWDNFLRQYDTEM